MAKPPTSPAFRPNERSKLARDLVTPEGIPLTFTLASAGDRAVAFAIDFLIQFGALVVVGIAMSSTGKSDAIRPLETVLAFLIFNFYFAFFEIRWQGRTIGKRVTGIRVIDARGGQLETSAVLARNLIRELEVWTPLRLLILHSTLWPDAPGWAIVLAIAWTFVFLFMPLFNKDRLRVGDLIAGTRVVMQPKVVLVPDLVSQAASSMNMRAQVAPTFTFTEAQLSIYGIYELQVLEGVLRQDPDSIAFYEAMSTVTDKIREKISYVGRIEDSHRFLKDFYVALRGHLEQRMLFGQRKRDKFQR